MQLKDLRPNPKNPRKMSKSDKDNLLTSLEKYGDLSGIINNVRTKRLVGAHQRKSVLPANSKITITERFDPPTKARTVAIGFVKIGEEKFQYREVDASEKWETEALLAANNHSGEWDKDLLKLNFNDFPDIDLSSTGFDLEEIKDMGIELSSLPSTFGTGFENDLDESDFSYARKNKGPSEEADIQRLPDTVKRTYPNKDATPSPVKDIDPDSPDNPFNNAGQKTNVVGKRHVIIIDCKSEEEKQALKEKLRPLVEETEAHFF